MRCMRPFFLGHRRDGRVGIMVRRVRGEVFRGNRDPLVWHRPHRFCVHAPGRPDPPLATAPIGPKLRKVPDNSFSFALWTLPASLCGPRPRLGLLPSFEALRGPIWPSSRNIGFTTCAFPRGAKRELPERLPGLPSIPFTSYCQLFWFGREISCPGALPSRVRFRSAPCAYPDRTAERVRPFARSRGCRAPPGRH